MEQYLNKDFLLDSYQGYKTIPDLSGRAAAGTSLWLLFGIFVQKVFYTNLICRFQRVKNQKNEGTIILLTFKIDVATVPLFFLIFYSLASKIEICLSYFLDKSHLKQPLWNPAQVSQKLTQSCGCQIFFSQWDYLAEFESSFIIN